jgi:hypothetical protein
MPDIPEVELWRMVSLWMFLLCLLFTSLLLWILAQYKWCRHGFLPPLEISQVEVELPRAADPQNRYHEVMLGFGTYRFVRLRMVNSGLIVSFSTVVRVYAAQGVCT